MTEQNSASQPIGDFALGQIGVVTGSVANYHGAAARPQSGQSTISQPAASPAPLSGAAQSVGQAIPRWVDWLLGLVGAALAAFLALEMLGPPADTATWAALAITGLVGFAVGYILVAVLTVLLDFLLKLAYVALLAAAALAVGWGVLHILSVL